MSSGVTLGEESKLSEALIHLLQAIAPLIIRRMPTAHFALHGLDILHFPRLLSTEGGLAMGQGVEVKLGIFFLVGHVEATRYAGNLG